MLLKRKIALTEVQSDNGQNFLRNRDSENNDIRIRY